MSDRAAAARATRTRLVDGLRDELTAIVDAGLSDQYLALTIAGRVQAAEASAPFVGDDHIFAPVVIRLVGELDEADLALVLKQEGPSLLRRPLAPGGSWLARRVDLDVDGTAPILLEDQIRAMLEHGLMASLRRHLRERADTFMPAREVQAA